MKNALVAAFVTALVLLCVFLTFSSRRGIAPKQSTVGPSLLDETTTHTPLVQESVTVQPPINQASPDPELLRLRGQVSVLRNALRTNEVQAQKFTPAEGFSDQGTLTPQASISSLFWAASIGERNRYKSMIVWGEEA